MSMAQAHSVRLSRQAGRAAAAVAAHRSRQITAPVLSVRVEALNMAVARAAALPLNHRPVVMAVQRRAFYRHRSGITAAAVRRLFGVRAATAEMARNPAAMRQQLIMVRAAAARVIHPAAVKKAATAHRVMFVSNGSMPRKWQLGII
jgi:hypothetical protein